MKTLPFQGKEIETKQKKNILLGSNINHMRTVQNRKIKGHLLKWLHVQQIINIICHNKKFKEKNHIILKDANEVLDKIQYSFMIF